MTANQKPGPVNPQATWGISNEVRCLWLDLGLIIGLLTGERTAQNPFIESSGTVQDLHRPTISLLAKQSCRSFTNMHPMDLRVFRTGKQDFKKHTLNIPEGVYINWVQMNPNIPVMRLHQPMPLKYLLAHKVTEQQYLKRIWNFKRIVHPKMKILSCCSKLVCLSSVNHKSGHIICLKCCFLLNVSGCFVPLDFQNKYTLSVLQKKVQSSVWNGYYNLICFKSYRFGWVYNARIFTFKWGNTWAIWILNIWHKIDVDS